MLKRSLDGKSSETAAGGAGSWWSSPEEVCFIQIGYFMGSGDTTAESATVADGRIELDGLITDRRIGYPPTTPLTYAGGVPS